MVVYNCELCDYNTKLKHDYNKHMKTKKHLKKLSILVEEDKDYLEDGKKNELMSQNEPEMSQKEPQMSQNEPAMSQKTIEQYKCDYCNSLFTTKANLRRHEIHRCKEYKNYKALYKQEKKEKEKLKLDSEKEKEKLKLDSEKAKEKLRKEWEKEKEKLYKEIEKLIDKVGNGNTTYNTTQNIILNSYGKENMEHITYEYKRKLLEKYAPLTMIPKLIEDIHFNDAVPENKNIVYPNKKENKVKIYKDDKWSYEDKKYIINDLIDDKYNIIEDHYEEYSSELNEMKQHRYDKFRLSYDNNNDKIIQSLQEECEMLLLNNR